MVLAVYYENPDILDPKLREEINFFELHPFGAQTPKGGTNLNFLPEYFES
jgi:hypothetical protein